MPFVSIGITEPFCLRAEADSQAGEHMVIFSDGSKPVMDSLARTS